MSVMNWLIAGVSLVTFVVLLSWWLPRLKGMAKGRAGGAMLAMSVLFSFLFSPTQKASIEAVSEERGSGSVDDADDAAGGKG